MVQGFNTPAVVAVMLANHREGGARHPFFDTEGSSHSLRKGCFAGSEPARQENDVAWAQ